MAKPSPQNPSHAGSMIQTLLVALSLLLNILLAAHLLKARPQAPVESTRFSSTAIVATSNSSNSLPAEQILDATEANTTSFQWSTIESADYRQYIANLRAAGCPEQVVRDIIVADLGQHFNKRAREIWPIRVAEYWQKNPNQQPSPKQLEQLMALGKEQGAALQDLLGVRSGRQELIDTLYLQVQGSERELLLLPLEKREAAMAALADADFESKEMKLQSSQGDYWGNQQKLFNEKLKVLADILTPEELDEFHQRNSPVGSVLKSEVRYLGLTPEEYKQLLFAKESGGAEKSTKDTVHELFGDERAKEFEHVSSAFYINARTGAEAEGIPLAQVDEAARFADDSMKLGLAAAQDKSLSVEERKARLKDLQARAEARIKELLGDKASKTVLRDLRNVLRSSATYIQP